MRSSAELLAAIEAPGFTPAARDAAALVDLLADGELPDKVTKLVIRALGKLGDRATQGASAALAAAAASSDDRTTSALRLLSALGAFARAGDDAALAALVVNVESRDERWRRAAISELSKLGGSATEGERPALSSARAAIIARWDRGNLAAPELRALARALGALGGAEGARRLATLDPGDDRELGRRRERGLITSQRDARGASLAEIDASKTPPAGALTWRGRVGLGPLLAEELRASGYRVITTFAERCTTDFASPLSRAFQARLWTHLGWRIPLPAGPLEGAVASALALPRAMELLRELTRGAITWRLELPGGPRRADVWRVVRAVSARLPELVNQPSAAAWTFIVDETARELELCPRRLADPRFTWRQADLPSASHPTVAAAIAFLGQARGGDRIWDPFTGSGSELIECAQRASGTGPPPILYGSDVDPRALDAARDNLRHAHLDATLELRDARAPSPRQVDLIATNPPLGGRLRGDAPALLCAAAAAFAAALAPRGRLVWITPAPRRTEPAARGAGLRLTRSLDIDLGGLRARLERWDKPR